MPLIGETVVAHDCSVSMRYMLKSLAEVLLNSDWSKAKILLWIKWSFIYLFILFICLFLLCLVFNFSMDFSTSQYKKHQQLAAVMLMSLATARLVVASSISTSSSLSISPPFLSVNPVFLSIPTSSANPTPSDPLPSPLYALASWFCRSPYRS